MKHSSHLWFFLWFFLFSWIIFKCWFKWLGNLKNWLQILHWCFFTIWICRVRFLLLLNTFSQISHWFVFIFSLRNSQILGLCFWLSTFLQLWQKQIEQRIWFAFLNLITTKLFKSQKYRDLQYNTHSLNHDLAKKKSLALMVSTRFL